MHHARQVGVNARIQVIATYNAASAGAMSGQPRRALSRLAEAFELDSSLRELAARDGDLAALHDEPAFTALIGA